MDMPEINGKRSASWVERPAMGKDGRIKISKEVISEIATQALLRVIGVRAASDHNEKQRSSQGVNISVEESETPNVVVDAFIETKYGFRIPDIAWYVQESIKNTLEQNTGYSVKAVNVFVQAVYFEEVQKPGQILMQRDKSPDADPPYMPPAEEDHVEKEEPKETLFANKPVGEKPLEEVSGEEKLPKKEKSSIFGRSLLSDKER